jgi:L-ascorbate metabolism protein UlaG (beta-lactamase superfamily)
MPLRFEARPFTGTLAAEIARPQAPGLALYWLGQAGFLLRGGGWRLLIDPYLSDSLAEKYRGTPLPHLRMMPPPLALAELGPLDLILCTHAHTDHMDPATLTPLMAAQPALRMMAPRAKRAEAMARGGIGAERVIGLDAGESITPLPGLMIRATRAAHEDLAKDESGAHLFLGYAISLADVTVFHSGDCIPYPGQVEEVRALTAGLALLPVNGRSAALAAQKVPGNFVLDEAITLAADAGIPHMIAHHFDMFDFNTVPRTTVEAAAARVDLPLALLPAATGTVYRLIA